jgi:SAM-dependent methyltransferase
MTSPGLLGDTSARDYSRKLKLFNSFAGRELRQAVASLQLKPAMRILDAGCGTGEILECLREAVMPNGIVVGIDLASAHIAAAKTAVSPETLLIQADLVRPPFAAASFDLVWSANTINHLHDPVFGAGLLAGLLRRGGRIALAQSSLIPEMYFAWDSRLERLTTEAVRQYYRDRYGLAETDLTAIRAIVGTLRGAKLHDVQAQTFVIERVSPLSAPDEDYLLQAIFQETWGERVRPYLSNDDYQELSELCDPQHPAYALRRPDFHFLQTFTVAVGRL